MTYPDARTVLAQAMTERELSQSVVDLAHALGWLVARWPAWRPTGTDPGVPDVLLVRPSLSDRPSLIFAELKSEKGGVTEAQARWLTALDLASHPCSDERNGIVVVVWRPSDLLSGRIEKELH